METVLQVIMGLFGLGICAVGLVLVVKSSIRVVNNGKVVSAMATEYGRGRNDHAATATPPTNPPADLLETSPGGWFGNLFGSFVIAVGISLITLAFLPGGWRSLLTEKIPDPPVASMVIFNAKDRTLSYPKAQIPSRWEFGAVKAGQIKGATWGPDPIDVPVGVDQMEVFFHSEDGRFTKRVTVDTK